MSAADSRVQPNEPNEILRNSPQLAMNQRLSTDQTSLERGSKRPRERAGGFWHPRAAALARLYRYATLTGRLDLDAGIRWRAQKAQT